jgi:hypothetical protein
MKKEELLKEVGLKEESYLYDILACAMDSDLFEEYSNSEDKDLNFVALCSMDARKVKLVSNYFDMLEEV